MSVCAQVIECPVSRSPRAWVRAALAAVGLALPRLRLELAEQLQLREQDRLLEVRCSWQALNWREHRCLLSTHGQGRRGR